MSPIGPPPTGLFSRLVAALARTRQGLIGQIERLFAGNACNASTLEALEELLIAADLGPAVAGQIIATLHQRLGRRDLKEPRHVEEAVKDEILSVLKATVPPASSADPDARPRVFQIGRAHV